MRKMYLAVLAVAVVLPAAVLVSERAEARPEYCVQKAWDYATRKAGPDRTTQAWDDYNSAFQDYNDCYGVYACNDRNIACMDPPAL